MPAHLVKECMFVTCYVNTVPANYWLESTKILVDCAKSMHAYILSS